MSVNNVGATQPAYAATNAKPASESKPANDKNDAQQVKPENENNKAGVYEPSGKKNESNVTKASDIRRMIDETNKQTDALREMILKMFNRQAEKNGLANGTAPFLSEGEMVEIDAETRAKAQADIAEGGYYSVENTGDRIFDFAAAYAGNDPKKLEQMQKAVEKGFQEAEKAWGGKLPQISQDTMEYVRKRFADKFAEISGASA